MTCRMCKASIRIAQGPGQKRDFCKDSCRHRWNYLHAKPRKRDRRLERQRRLERETRQLASVPKSRLTTGPLAPNCICPVPLARNEDGRKACGLCGRLIWQKETA